EDVFALEPRNRLAAIDISARDADAGRLRISRKPLEILIRQYRIDQRLSVRALLRAILRWLRRRLWVETPKPLAKTPPVVAAFGDDVQFFETVLSDIRREQLVLAAAIE